MGLRIYNRRQERKAEAGIERSNKPSLTSILNRIGEVLNELGEGVTLTNILNGLGEVVLGLEPRGPYDNIGGISEKERRLYLLAAAREDEGAGRYGAASESYEKVGRLVSAADMADRAGNEERALELYVRNGTFDERTLMLAEAVGSDRTDEIRRKLIAQYASGGGFYWAIKHARKMGDEGMVAELERRAKLRDEREKELDARYAELNAKQEAVNAEMKKHSEDCDAFSRTKW